MMVGLRIELDVKISHVIILMLSRKGGKQEAEKH